MILKPTEVHKYQASSHLLKESAELLLKWSCLKSAQWKHYLEKNSSTKESKSANG